ncbi:MAG: hypothetical protein AB1730_15655 [Myxococcota bacterium]|jgi:hypothetical protein
MTALASLDGFLAAPAQRDVTRAALHGLFAGRGLTLVFGDADAAAELVGVLARVHPARGLNALLLEVAPARITARANEAGAQPREVPEASLSQLLRLALRQDPDLIAVARTTPEGGPLLFTALTTGHQVIAGSGLGSTDAFFDLLSGAEPGLRPHAVDTLDQALEVRRDMDGRPRIVRVQRRVEGALVDVVRCDGEACTLAREHLPGAAPRGPLYTPRLAPPVTKRTPARVRPRPAFLPRVSEDASGPHRLGARRVLRATDGGWPRCRGCQQPLAHVVQLDLSALPEPLVRAPALAQLFVCTRGCESATESSPGVLVELVPLDGLVEVDADGDGGGAEVQASGGLIGFTRVDEEPSRDDRGEGDAHDSDDEASALPLRCDKLGGWPAWEQGPEWPDGAGWELLFQVVEGPPLEGGTADGWDFDAAALVKGTPPTRVLDPNAPRHFVSLLTSEATAFLFRSADSKRLAFRWQTG